eukprot:CAMPEP_0179914576 /NCGR_PEP_ID=MMETSP0983-20121128/1161_1 /TAXON_ID=483367 /ORGANISM="non described non described, Strain CCMP 2436" /LENGTH=250 /DNA_ID=CAMNT_0021816829 /DNA_START=259 /DNA_END=1013 /DNA_ORIENTATION=-
MANSSQRGERIAHLRGSAIAMQTDFEKVLSTGARTTILKRCCPQAKDHVHQGEEVPVSRAAKEHPSPVFLPRLLLVIFKMGMADVVEPENERRPIEERRASAYLCNAGPSVAKKRALLGELPSASGELGASGSSLSSILSVHSNQLESGKRSARLTRGHSALPANLLLGVSLKRWWSNAFFMHSLLPNAASTASAVGGVESGKQSVLSGCIVRTCNPTLLSALASAGIKGALSACTNFSGRAIKYPLHWL